jgi:hypothetical protein
VASSYPAPAVDAPIFTSFSLVLPAKKPPPPSTVSSTAPTTGTSHSRVGEVPRPQVALQGKTKHEQNSNLEDQEVNGTMLQKMVYMEVTWPWYSWRLVGRRGEQWDGVQVLTPVDRRYSDVLRFLYRQNPATQQPFAPLQHPDQV